MIDFQTFQQIRWLADHKKLKVSQIEGELNLDPKTVPKWVDQPRYQLRQSPKRSRQLDPFKGPIVALLERYSYTAQQILQRIREQGFAGDYTVVKEFERQVRPVRNPCEPLTRVLRTSWYGP